MILTTQSGTFIRSYISRSYLSYFTGFFGTACEGFLESTILVEGIATNDEEKDVEFQVVYNVSWSCDSCRIPGSINGDIQGTTFAATQLGTFNTRILLPMHTGDSVLLIQVCTAPSDVHSILPVPPSHLSQKVCTLSVWCIWNAPISCYLFWKLGICIRMDLLHNKKVKAEVKCQSLCMSFGYIIFIYSYFRWHVYNDEADFWDTFNVNFAIVSLSGKASRSGLSRPRGTGEAWPCYLAGESDSDKYPHLGQTQRKSYHRCMEPF